MMHLIIAMIISDITAGSSPLQSRRLARVSSIYRALSIVMLALDE